MPSNEPLYTSTIAPPVPPDRPLTATCAQVATLPAPANKLACGNYGVNTMQPIFNPSGAFGALIPAQTNPTIGDRLTRQGRRLGVVRRVAGRTPTATWALPAGRTARRPPRHRPAAWIPTSIRAIAAASRPRLAALPEQPVPVPPPAVQLLPELLDRDDGRPGQSRRASQGRGRVRELASARPRSRATSSRSASSSRSGRRTSIRATPASPTAATTWWTCCQVHPGQRVRQGHDGHRDLRRVRRSVGSRPTAGHGNDAGPTTSGAPGRASRRWSSRRT